MHEIALQGIRPRYRVSCFPSPSELLTLLTLTDPCGVGRVGKSRSVRVRWTRVFDFQVDPVMPLDAIQKGQGNILVQPLAVRFGWNGNAVALEPSGNRIGLP